MSERELPTEKDKARFWAKVERHAPNWCWVWRCGRFAAGYGQFWFAGTSVMAHRFAWETERGPIPEGFVIDHRCRNHQCVNPAHMDVVTCRENILRGMAPPADNARKTHCDFGHALSGDNLGRYGGKRFCRICRRKRGLAAYHARKARHVA